jgi:CheY-like chemotaxis protein
MGGELDCSSTPGRGSRFWITLPLEPVSDYHASADLQQSDLRAHSASLRVLLADDHPTNRRVVELMLDGTGVELTTAEDGREALELFRTQTFDIVLMDMQMPVMDGLTAVREIRLEEARSGRARTPTLMLTANVLPEHVAAGADAGADGHLAKPLNVQALFEALEGAALGVTNVETACEPARSANR